MAFVKYARASVVQPLITREQWLKIRVAGNRTFTGRTGADRSAKVDLAASLTERASSLFDRPFSPKDYLLSHATIVSSVDTYAPKGMKLGKVMENGFRVNRKYPDFRIVADCQKYINNNCFVPGTPITMADGTTKHIEDVRPGDMVLTHKGRARRVVETFRHDMDGEILEIKVRGSNERLFVTPEHPFYAFRPNTECVACSAPIARKHRTVSHLLGKHYCSKECYYQHKVPNAALLREKTGEFVEATDLTTNDFAAVPVVSGEQDVGLTLGQARLVGLFAAEGYYELDSRNGNERVGVCWAFHEEERHTLAKAVCDLMRSEFGVECVIRPHRDDRGIHVTTKTCRKAVDFFSGHVSGEGATDKRLHCDLLTAPLAVQVEILRGWFEGDGSAFDTGAGRDVSGDFRLTATSASQSLANQMRVLLHRQGIAPRMSHDVSEGRRRLVVDGAAHVVSDPSKECHSWVVSCGAGYIGDLVQDTVYADAYEAAVEARGSFRQAPDLRFLNGYCLQMLTDIASVEYRGPVYNFETEEDHSYIAGGVAVHNCDAWSRGVIGKSYETFVGGHNFVEHVQIEDLSKGRIIDAVSRDVGESVYVDILIATERKHRDLIAAVQSGAMATLSMGCTIDGSICTKCGHWASDETEMCSHIKYEKGNTFFDREGRQHIVAELCGHLTLDPTGGVYFIEASWVETPAFAGAVLRNVIEPTIEMVRQAHKVLSSPPTQWSEKAMKKAASTFPIGSVKMRAARLAELRAEQVKKARLSQMEDDVMPDEDAAEEEAPAEETPLLQGLEDDLTQAVLEKVKKRLQESIQGPDTSLTPEQSTSTNENMQHLAASRTAAAKLYRGMLTSIARTASSDVQMVDRVAAFHQSIGLDVPVPVYRAVLKVGAMRGYHSKQEFLTSCRKTLGRNLTQVEAGALIRLGRLLSQIG